MPEGVSVRSKVRRQAAGVAATYALIAGAWILVSDRALTWAVGEPELWLHLSVYKGLGFVAVTTAVLYLGVRRSGAAIERSWDALQRKELERQRHEEQLRHADAILASSNDAIVSRGADGRITSWNAAAEHIFGLSHTEMLGNVIDPIIPSDLRPEADALTQRVLAGERPAPLSTTRLHADGRRIPVAITYSPITSYGQLQSGARGVDGVSEIIQDVTERQRIAAAAERERHFSTSLLEAMPGIFYLYEETGGFLRWNANFERVTGYASEEIRRLRALDLFADEEKPLLRSRIAEVFATGESNVEAGLRSKSGEILPYYFTGKHLALDGRDCLIGVGVDITRRRQAEEALRRSEERYRTTLDSILEGCQLLDSDWRYLYLNEAASQQNRRANTDLLGRRMPEAWPGIETTSVFSLLQRCMRDRRSAHDEVVFTFPDGTTGCFDVRAQPVPEGIIVLSIDITERKRAERALQVLNDELETKIAQRTRDLEAALARAESADRVKSAFLATMSHELRTPLNSIIGFTAIVLQGLAGPLTPEQIKQLGMVRSSARHLLALINDVLDISKIEAGQLEVRAAPFELRASIERVAALVSPLVERKQLQLHVRTRADSIPMDSDQRRVEQVLLNLINNAIKFTERGTITVAAELDPDDSGSVRIDVIDTGIGIKAEDIQQLFLPFRQADTGLQRQHEGTGLGLAICQRLTGLLGGRIHVESTWGTGSRFSIWLPTQPR